jgi:hypothetical protein
MKVSSRSLINWLPASEVRRSAYALVAIRDVIARTARVLLIDIEWPPKGEENIDRVKDIIEREDRVDQKQP